MKRSAISRILLVVCLIWHLSDTTEKVSAYEVPVHSRLTVAAYDLSVLKHSYLIHLGIEQETRLNGQSAGEWIRLGSEFEDGEEIESLSLRPLNHFYDPVTQSGLLGLPDFIATDAINWGLELRSTGTLTQGWSVRDARDYLFKGLTNQDPKIRELNLAKTFRALGQVVHLIQDMAQPAHVRNDPHPSFSQNSNNIINRDHSRYEAHTNEQVPIGTYNLLGYPPVRFNDFISFWTAGGRGLADFTNANFVSEDTNFKSLEDGATDGRHPNPTLDTNDFSIASIQDIASGATDVHGNLLQGNLLFFGNNYTDLFTNQTAHNNRMTTRSIFDGDLKSVFTNPVFTLNQLNFDAQAKILLPRAVGYSAGLIDYFFRGTLEISMPENYVYGIIDGSQQPQQFTRLKAKVLNTTSGEEIQTGTLYAVAQYKKRLDYQPDLSADPPTATSREDDFSYSVSEPIDINSLSADVPTEFTFDFASKPIPAGITDLYLMIVFKGALGNETEAIAVGRKDLFEPMHVNFFNASDYFYLDQVLRSVAEIRGDAALKSRVDFDQDGILSEPGEPYIDPYDYDIQVRFHPTNAEAPVSPHATYHIPPGRFGRLIILFDPLAPGVDFQLTYRYFSQQQRTYLTDSFILAPVINQDQDETFIPRPIESFRGIAYHGAIITLESYPTDVGYFIAPWPQVINREPFPIDATP